MGHAPTLTLVPLLLLLGLAAWTRAECYRNVCLLDCEQADQRCIAQHYCEGASSCDGQTCATVCRNYVDKVVDYARDVLMDKTIQNKQHAKGSSGVGLEDLLKFEGANAEQLKMYGY